MKQQQQQVVSNGDHRMGDNHQQYHHQHYSTNNNNSTNRTNIAPPPVTTPQQRPYDTLGPPSDPVEFPRPQLVRGRRDTVLCYNPMTDEHEVLEQVLFRDCLIGRSSAPPPAVRHNNRSSSNASSTSGSTSRNNNNNNINNTNSNCHDAVTRAYWPIPYKAKIQTIMGHVEMCRVLKRCIRHRDDDDFINDDDSSNEEGSYDDDDDEIVFEWTDQRVAVKVNYTDRMDRLRDRHAENPLQEIAAMQLLGTDPCHVLGAMDVLFDGQNLNVVMRYCDSGDLFQLLQDRQNQIVDASNAAIELNNNVDALPPPPGLPEGEVRYWFRQVMDGVKYLHSCGICHRDLSPENIMIDGDEGVIIDMGMCLRVPYVDPNNVDARTDITKTKGTRTTATRCLIRPQGACGKLPYMSPEILASRHAFDGEAADVWTSGTILFCMVTGNRSYQRPHISDPQFYWMTQGLRQLLSDWNVRISEEGIALLQGMLEVDPRKRLTLDEVCQHPWFSHPDEPPMKMETEPGL